MIRFAEREAEGPFENVRAFLQYVQGSSGVAEEVPPAIVRDLVELEERTRRVRALTGLMGPAELSPYVLELLHTPGGRRAVSAERLLGTAGG